MHIWDPHSEGMCMWQAVVMLTLQIHTRRSGDVKSSKTAPADEPSAQWLSRSLAVCVSPIRDQPPSYCLHSRWEFCNPCKRILQVECLGAAVLVGVLCRDWVLGRRRLFQAEYQTVVWRCLCRMPSSVSQAVSESLWHAALAGCILLLSACTPLLLIWCLSCFLCSVVCSPAC